MALLKEARPVDDPWTAVADGEPLPDGGPILLSLERWQAERAALAGTNRRLGVRLDNHQDPGAVAGDLERLALIALDFPAFTDGRAYSQARILRERLGFRGELRATGEVLRDQWHFMARCGFDSCVVEDGSRAAGFATAIDEVSVAYQPIGDGTSTLALRRRRRALIAEHGDAQGPALIRAMIKDVFPGRIAVVSSFGAEAAVLLDMVAAIDPATPVIFLDTGKHFPETLAFRDVLAAHLGLRDVRSVTPDAAALARQDGCGTLWKTDPDRCCRMRKVLPLAGALAGFDAWITGRKRYQGEVRADLPTIETVAGQVKVNPLAGWSRAQVATWLETRGLPRHPLVERGYPSIGCAPCTRPVAAGEPARAGRWTGSDKTECGIHAPRAFER